MIYILVTVSRLETFGAAFQLPFCRTFALTVATSGWYLERKNCSLKN